MSFGYFFEDLLQLCCNSCKVPPVPKPKARHFQSLQELSEWVICIGRRKSQALLYLGFHLRVVVQGQKLTSEGKRNQKGGQPLCWCYASSMSAKGAVRIVAAQNMNKRLTHCELMISNPER